MNRNARGSGPVPRRLARRAGVPVSTLRNWENGPGFPGVPAFLRLAEALGVPAEWLAEGVDDPAEEAAEPAGVKRDRCGSEGHRDKARPAAPSPSRTPTAL